MEWLNGLLDNATAPVLIAFLLGLLTAISPCPLATNIASIGYISRDIENRKTIFVKGVLYTFGRILAYTALGIILISILEEGASIFGVQKYVSKFGELLISPILILIGLFMLWGHKLNLPNFGLKQPGETYAKKGGWGAFLLGALFALVFCPSSGMFYFGMLIPLSISSTSGWFLPVIYAFATALPVLAVAWLLAFSVQNLSKFYGKIQIIQKWLNLFVGILFLIIGLYYGYLMYL
ncbi:MAG: sulfite exporter TauE/SafE family protein [Muribaculaceae bacterium]|nr:sulfite exporter TauE/SafE family protein [Muribaculaceae bacterium]